MLVICNELQAIISCDDNVKSMLLLCEIWNPSFDISDVKVVFY